jgi:small subunit ribosomal protein S1
VGCGLPSLIPIDSISVSRISHPSDRFYVGQNISAVVKSLDGRKISLSHKELLGTWEENAAFFHAGETVAGIIRSIENYGVFVELTPNLAGLAELRDGVRVNHQASVYIKAIIPEKMKIKLIIVDSFPAQKINYNYTYFVSKPHIDVWTYSTKESDKLIQTVF